MPSLELLIRPYQAPTTIIARRIVEDGTKVADEEAVAEWGEAGDLPAAEKEERNAEGGIDFNIIECDDQYKETKRNTTDIKVTQQGNADNFIVFSQIDKISFDKKEKKDGGNTDDKTSTAFAPRPYVLPDGSNSAFPPSGLELGNDDSNKCKSDFTLHNPPPAAS